MLSIGAKPQDARRPLHGGAEPLLVAVNGTASGARDPEELLAEVLAHMPGRAHGWVTRSESDLHALLADAERAVLVGGDGTLHAAANAGVPLPELAIVPAGRANNIARALGIPPDLPAAARLAATGTARPVDLVRVETELGVVHAVEGVSAGFQAEARGLYGGASSADLRAGARALATTVRRYRPYRVELTLDGQPAYTGDAAQVFLANLPFFGFGFRVNPLARVGDGLIEAIVAAAGSRPALARLLVAAYRGSHLERDGVVVRRVREAVIESPLPLVCDSAVLGCGTAAVRVVPAGLWVVA